MGYAGESWGQGLLWSEEADFVHGSNVVRIHSSMGAGARASSLVHTLSCSLSLYHVLESLSTLPSSHCGTQIRVDDQMAQVKQPLRVVSLLPSATELVWEVLKAASRTVAPQDLPVLVGRSHECDFPAEYEHLPTLTASKITFTNSADVDRQVREQLNSGVGLYTLDTDLLKALRPDVIVTQSLCQVCSVDYCMVENIVLGMDPPPVLVDTNPSSLEDVMNDVRKIGDALRLSTAAAVAIESLQTRIRYARQRASESANKVVNVAFCEWIDPIFPGGHWTPQLIEAAGGSHPLNPSKNGGAAAPSAAISHETFISSDPDVIIIAPCGLSLESTKKELAPLVSAPWWKELRAVRSGRVWLVDGNQMFNRPGPRLVDALEWLVFILHGSAEDDYLTEAAQNFPAKRLCT